MIKKISCVVVLTSLVGGLFSSASAIPIGNNVEFIPDSRSLGLGIMPTDAKLDVNGQIKIRGGNPQPGYVLTTVGADGLATWGPLEGAAIGFENVTLSGATVIGNDPANTLNITGTTTFTGAINLTNATISGLDALTMTGLLTSGSIDTGTISAEAIVVSTGAGTITANKINSADGSGIENLNASFINWIDPITSLPVPAPTATRAADATHADAAAALDAGTNVVLGDVSFENPSTFDGAGVTFNNMGNLTAGGLASGTAVTLGNLDFVASSTFDASNITSFTWPAGFSVPSADTLTADATVASATVTTLSLGTSPTQSIIDTEGSITPSSSIVRIQGDGAPVVLAITTDQIDAGTTDGQFLILRGMHDTFTVTVNHETDDSNAGTTEVILNSGVQFTMGKNDTLTLIYDALANAWLEVSRTDVLN